MFPQFGPTGIINLLIREIYVPLMTLVKRKMDANDREDVLMILSTCLEERGVLLSCKEEKHHRAVGYAGRLTVMQSAGNVAKNIKPPQTDGSLSVYIPHKTYNAC
jgi:hypothetical protein